MITTLTQDYQITWEKLPDDYVLPDEPVDNINQPALAAALTESLEVSGKLPENALSPTNYGICATLNGKIIIKAPDWAYVPSIRVAREELKRSYTPQLQGDMPVIVMEFTFGTDSKAYSIKPTYPVGKWFFYERILKVLNYVIFEPDSGTLEVYRLDNAGQYSLQAPDENNRYRIVEMNLYLGVQQGTRENRIGYWLRWWNEQGQLLWGSELAEQERQRAEQERQRAEQERQRAERLIAQLRAAGIEPEV